MTAQQVPSGFQRVLESEGGGALQRVSSNPAPAHTPPLNSSTPRDGQCHTPFQRGQRHRRLGRETLGQGRGKASTASCWLKSVMNATLGMRAQGHPTYGLLSSVHIYGEALLQVTILTCYNICNKATILTSCTVLRSLTCPESV